MKKSILLFTMILSAIFFTSCKGNQKLDNKDFSLIGLQFTIYTDNGKNSFPLYKDSSLKMHFENNTWYLDYNEPIEYLDDGMKCKILDYDYEYNSAYVKGKKTEGWVPVAHWTGQIYWSDEYTPPYTKIDYEGVECIRYPWGNEGVDYEYILILENLKLREMPTLSSKLVTVDGFKKEDAGYYLGARSIALAGQVCTIRAKTVKKDTIDGITAPWYLIDAFGIDDMGLDSKPAFVFGGYVKEIKESDLEKTKEAYIGTLKESIRKLGGSTY